MIKIKGKNINYSCISVILILIGEMCFYTLDSISIYLFITGIGMFLGIAHNINRFSFRIKKNSFILWISIMWSIYFIYGIFFLQKGQFPWDTLGYRFIEIVALYLSISNMFLKDIKEFENAITISGVFSVVYLICGEGTNILLGGQRIGETLSGNVNTVGYNFGILSTLTMWFYCQKKQIYKMILFLIFTIIMLITGSKKVLIMIIANLMMYFWYEKKKINGWLKTIFIFVIGIYAIFNIPYFYNIIGSRIEAMAATFLGNSNILYSHSTEVREAMIKEAFKLFLNNPILGGGWNYFYANTIYEYEYSHCNYTEMLCTFGIIGTAIFYGRHIYDIKIALSKNNLRENKNFIVLIFILTTESLILDWAAVTFSAQCSWYLPVLICAAAIRTISYAKLDHYRTESIQYHIESVPLVSRH